MEDQSTEEILAQMEEAEEKHVEAIEQEQAAEQTAPEPEPAPEPQMFEYQALGKTISEDLDTILKRASMGYDYAQKAKDLKDQMASAHQVREEALATQKKWEHLDQYARENPEWHQHVQDAWNKREAYQTGAVDSDDPTMNYIKGLENKLSEFESFKKEMLEYQQQQRVSKEDAALAEEIKSIQSQYPDLDFRASDPATGKTLEYAVLEHANANGINKFSTAFKDFYSDKLVAMAREKAKAELANSVKENKKSGLLGKTEAPTIGLSEASVAGKSYEEIYEDILSELNLN
jgi:hypothetical protein